MAVQFLKYSDGKAPLKLLKDKSTMRIFTKPKNLWGCHIGPQNLLELNTRTCNSDKFWRQNGNMSLIWLFPRFRTSSALQLIKDCGIFPRIWLWLRSRVFKLFPALKNVRGIFPKNLFPCMFNASRELLKLPKHCGIITLNLLFNVSRTMRSVKLHNCKGRLPLQLLFEIKKVFRGWWCSYKWTLQRICGQVQKVHIWWRWILEIWKACKIIIVQS